MRLSGFNQEGGKVTGSIDNLEITSLQNKSKTTGSSRGVTIGAGSNGVPSSASISGSRAYVDNQTTFILGEGSNLTIGKAENTAGIIGTEGNGKLKINEYKGTDLYNHDNLTTTGGSIGVDFGKGGAKVNGVGVNNENHRKEGITRNTVIGNVEIGSATGSPINRDRSKANETTRDDHSSTNVYIEGQTIDYATNPSKLKEDIGKAKDEIKDIGRAIKESLNDRGDDNRNFLGQLSEGSLQRTIENIAGERLRKSTTQEDISKILKDTYKDLGYDVEIIFTTPDKAPQLIDEKGKIKAGTAYVGADGKHTILINTEAKDNQTRAGLIGTITEEGSHVIGKVEGRQRKVPEGSEEKGLESTGRATNEFFNKTYQEGNIPIQTKSDGKDYSKADFGEHVGDDTFVDAAIHYNAIKRIKENNYELNSDEFRKELLKVGYTKDFKRKSYYFGFYFLPKEVQKKYLTKDKDGDEGLNFEILDPKGFKKLENKKEYTIAMYKVNIEVFKAAGSFFEKNGIKNFATENPNVTQNFLGEGKKGYLEAWLRPGDLDITLRTGTLKSYTIIETKKVEGGIYIKLIREHKIYDEFKQPYNIGKLLHINEESGNPYKLISNYHKHVILEGVFKNKSEALNEINRKINEAREKVEKVVRTNKK